VHPLRDMSFRPRKGREAHSDPVRLSGINFDNTTCTGIISVSKSRGYPLISIFWRKA
jgi:hypothetical protein